MSKLSLERAREEIIEAMKRKGEDLYRYSQEEIDKAAKELIEQQDTEEDKA
jgi:hypothetical protein